ncbi:MAG TPA: BMP family ABC transporter substrate-binding protein [Coleofasciculaceae cyanobacterium]|jgi:basic membrane lipoprotein Med (substrate-binding protein (PBP1-ABC) superfamily)
MTKKIRLLSTILSLPLLALAACTPSTPSASTSPAAEKQSVGVVLDTGGENDKSFNEYTIKGAKAGADAAGLGFAYVASAGSSDYEKNIETQISEGADLIVTVGFLMGDATAAMAKKYPDTKFVIIDYAYAPGADGVDPYTTDLKNVTSLMFAEDQAGYLAGVLAGCVSAAGKVATVSGMEIPPVQRYVQGFQAGAKSVNPSIVTLNQYIPDFNDPATGKSVGQSFLSQGADIIFAVGGNTGNGGLLAAKEAGRMGIGVDVDQYLTYPEVKDALLTSATKNIDVATTNAIQEFAAGQLKPGIELATIASGGVGLAPYHDAESKVSQECKAKVTSAQAAIKADPKIMGVN